MLSSKLTYIWKLFPFVIAPYLLLWTIYEWATLFSHLFSVSSPDVAKLGLFTVVSCVVSLVSLRVCLPLKTVILYGDFLQVGVFSSNSKIPLSEVLNVSGPDGTTLSRITIELKPTSNFGHCIVFSPALFQANDIADALRERTQN